jgi:Fe-S-cluster containining protein
MSESIPAEFKRTTCACSECVKCCKRQAGPLTGGDMERIAAHLGESVEDAKRHFCASPGALVRVDGKTVRVGSITPKMRRGRCVFLNEHDRCSIHAVAPFGCAYFDVHMSRATAMPRSLWLVKQCAQPSYQQLRNDLDYATSYRPIEY